MKLKFRFVFLFLFLLTPLAHASEVTHLIGTTGYMIREAMHAGANKKDPTNYYKAVKLQSLAKAAFRGTGKTKRNLNQAVALTREAYLAAKLARDNAAPSRYKNSKDNFYRSIGK